jgi:hypothetical protein
MRRVDTHTIDDHVNIDDIIESTVNNHSLTGMGNGEATNLPVDTLLAYISGQSTSNGSSPGDICHVFAAKQSTVGKKGKTLKVNKTSIAPDSLTVGNCTYFLNKGETITFQGRQYFTHSTVIQYCVGQHEATAPDMALIDRGANGCVCGDDMRVLEGSERFVDISGLGGHCENKLCIVAAQALVVAIFHQMALLGKGTSILSCLQMEHYEINDKSLRLAGGLQRIVMDGYQIPLAFRNGLPYLKCQPRLTPFLM